MNWKSHPNIFANGKFKFNHVALKDPNVLDISTLYKVFSADILNECTLIARPINDMSDTELRSTMHEDDYSTRDPEYIRRLIKRRVSGRHLKRDEFLYLLSIGVYPFDDTEGVIFKPKQS